MKALCFVALLLAALPASAKINSTDLSQWLPALPVKGEVQSQSRPAHLAEWIPKVKPGMAVTQVLVMLGNPDWGYIAKGKLRWAASPREGVLRYTVSKDCVVDYVFDNDARVKRIVENGVIVARGRRLLLPDPLPHGVFWRK